MRITERSFLFGGLLWVGVYLVRVQQISAGLVGAGIGKSVLVTRRSAAVFA